MSKMIAESSALPPRSPQPQAGPARVSVVIVVWNAKQYVVECLGSLREHCEEMCSEVIVVDNASTDGTPELVAEMFPDFKLIRNRGKFRIRQGQQHWDGGEFGRLHLPGELGRKVHR